METESHGPVSAPPPLPAAEPISYASANLPKPVFLPTRDRVLTSRLSRAMGIGFTAVGLILGSLVTLAAADMNRSLAWVAVGVVVGLYLLPGLVLWRSASPVKRGGLAPLIFVLIGCLWIAASTLLTFLGEAWIMLNGTLLEGVWVRMAVAGIFFIAVGFLLYHDLRAMVLGANAADADGKVLGIKDRVAVVCLPANLKTAGFVCGGASFLFNLIAAVAAVHLFIVARLQPKELGVNPLLWAILACCCGVALLLAITLMYAARYWGGSGEVQTDFLVRYVKRRVGLTLFAVLVAI